MRAHLRSFSILPLLAGACGDAGDPTGDSTSDTSEAETESEETESGETESGETESGETESGETGPEVCVSPSVPIEGDALLEWLATADYAQWQAESGPHDSAGPHFGDVRTFVDPCLFESLDAGAATHPVGATAVKELYGAGDVVLGWSVMVKVAAGEGGDTWFWHETYQGSTYASAVGADLCTGCHGGAGNLDYVLSPFPLQ